MISFDGLVSEQNGIFTRPVTFYGLHDDSKPTSGVANGSCFIEMDTNKAYWFDAEHSTWIEAQ